ALSHGEGIYRRGIPIVEVKIAKSRIGRFVAPGILPDRFLRSAVRRTVPLLFRGQRLPCPARIGRRLCVAHINRPIQWQRDLFEHRAIKPSLVSLAPENGVRDRMLRFPPPTAVTPE